jgi:hypothetical protein
MRPDPPHLQPGPGRPPRCEYCPDSERHRSAPVRLVDEIRINGLGFTYPPSSTTSRPRLTRRLVAPTEPASVLVLATRRPGPTPFNVPGPAVGLALPLGDECLGHALGLGAYL